ncbi:hypothetical protein [Mesobacillus maritimus]|uniref:Uncharacterized protein n=1 Tax=Mesobacillus maritimus TaxID=1643336 RepID=A0ABS7K7T0_9BACI|nr:hypothetical protein [Mesobacillus maritimus]MBY0098322.1 hypothetical protein [Mesobacillus maritimus]
MLVNVKVWGNDLNCDVCSNDKWYKRTLKTEFESQENALIFEEEVRYLFECSNCGNCKLFGMVSRETNPDEVNLTIMPVGNE